MSDQYSTNAATPDTTRLEFQRDEAVRENFHLRKRLVDQAGELGRVRCELDLALHEVAAVRRDLESCERSLDESEDRLDAMRAEARARDAL